MTAKLYQPGDVVKVFSFPLLAAIHGVDATGNICFHDKGWQNVYTSSMGEKFAAMGGRATILRRDSGNYFIEEGWCGIADEIIQGYWFDPGDTILVRDHPSHPWEPRIFLDYYFSSVWCLPEDLPLSKFDVYTSGEVPWRYSKPMGKEPQIQLDLKVNGEPVSPDMMNQIAQEVARLLRKE